MLIGFTGAQSTGKSTLLNQMFNDTSFRKCSFIKEVTRKVARRGLNINELGDNVTQLFILNEHLTNHHLTGCTILDRCILDGWVYTQYLHEQGKVDKWVLDYAWKLLTLLVPKLDIIFYTDPVDVPLVDDKVRSVDKTFREEIIRIYMELLSGENYYPDVETISLIRSRTVFLSGDVTTRYKTIEKTISTHNLI